MLAMIVRRLVTMVPVLFLVSILVFGLMALLPGDPAVTIAGGANASTERIAEIREKLGLDDPFVVQYLRWLGDAVRLDFGESLVTGKSVSEGILTALPGTLSISLGAIFFGILVGIPVGVIAGMRAGGTADRALIFGTVLGIAIPGFWLAMLLVLLFGVTLGWLPAVGFVPITTDPVAWLRTIILPSVAMGTFIAASLARQVRGELSEVMQRSYIRTAWAKGASPARVVVKHALKNAAIPAVTVLGVQLGGLLGGTVIIEQIFAMPGLGTYLLNAITATDMPIIMGVTTIFVVVYLAVSLLMDIVYAVLNPKVRIS